MFSFLDHVGIGAKLPMLIGLLVALAIGVSGVQSYLSMRSALQDEATARLTAIGAQRADQISDIAGFDALEAPQDELQ